jgi:hypothetical protein
MHRIGAVGSTTFAKHGINCPTLGAVVGFDHMLLGLGFCIKKGWGRADETIVSLSPAA